MNGVPGEVVPGRVRAGTSDSQGAAPAAGSASFAFRQGGGRVTARQKAFVQEYLIDLNATQAAIRAGYSPRTANRTASENLSKPDIKAYIAEQMERIRTQRTADAQEVLEYLTAVLRGESRSHVLALCGDGCQEVVSKPPDERERLKAAELLGKRFGLYTDKLELEGEDVNLNITIDYGEGPGP